MYRLHSKFVIRIMPVAIGMKTICYCESADDRNLQKSTSFNEDWNTTISKGKQRKHIFSEKYAVCENIIATQAVDTSRSWLEYFTSFLFNSNWNVESSTGIEQSIVRIDIADGIGKWTFENGDYYEGEWKSGQMNGQGVYTYENGDFYSGEMKNNKRHGKGIMTYVDGSIYDGEYANDLKNGTGTMHWEHGETYVGEWKDNYMHGQGRHVNKYGDVYEGSFVQDKRHGLGYYKSSDRNIDTTQPGFYQFRRDMIDKYEGYFADDKRDGVGIMTCRNGNIYEGSFKNNWREGLGTMRYQNGAVYSGEWKQDRMHGHGKMLYRSGKVYYEGLWDYNSPHK